MGWVLRCWDDESKRGKKGHVHIWYLAYIIIPLVGGALSNIYTLEQKYP